MVSELLPKRHKYREDYLLFIYLFIKLASIHRSFSLSLSFSWWVENFHLFLFLDFILVGLSET